MQKGEQVMQKKMEETQGQFIRKQGQKMSITM